MSERINSAQQFDVLGDVLEKLKFSGTIFFKSQLAAPWGMSLDTSTSPRFHISITGDFFIGPDGVENPVAVKEMDAIILPRGNAHWIADQPDRQLIKSELAGEACELGNPMFQQGDITNSVMCGLIQFEEQVTHPLLTALPEVIHVSHIDDSSPIWNLIEIIDNEYSSTDTLNSSVIDRLSEVLFIKLLQEYIDKLDEDIDKSVGFFSALRDRRLTMTLQLIHQRMSEDWTIIKLADEVGMSRATLVRRFGESVGMPPIEYLTHWRLLQARRLMKYSSQTLEDIAEQVGFSSKQTLSKAFKRHYGYTPSSLRRATTEKAKQGLLQPK